jgi:hypothetical protein
LSIALLTLRYGRNVVKSTLDRPAVSSRGGLTVRSMLLGMEGRGDETAVDAAVAALLRAYADTVAALRAMREPERHFARTTELGEVLRDLLSKSTDERALAAERILEAESLSLTALGERISTSKQRAGQLLEKAKKARGELVMTENMTVIPEVWPVAADRVGIWLISGDDAWRTAAVPADSEPHFELEMELTAHGVRDQVTMMHSTSWRIDGPHLIVTYMAVVAADDLARGIWQGARPVTATLAAAVGKPPLHAPTEAPAPRYIDVLMHGLRHLRFLMNTDTANAEAMGPLMRQHLEPLQPALAGLYAA